MNFLATGWNLGMRFEFKSPALVGLAVIVGLMVCAAIGLLPKIIVGICLAASAASFVMMSIDKQRATQRRRRIPEQTLHLLELAGGWPGSLAAQHLIRHKNRKVAYQVPFYFCVVLNCGFLLWMAI